MMDQVRHERLITPLIRSVICNASAVLTDLHHNVVESNSSYARHCNHVFCAETTSFPRPLVFSVLVSFTCRCAIVIFKSVICMRVCSSGYELHLHSCCTWSTIAGEIPAFPILFFSPSVLFKGRKSFGEWRMEERGEEHKKNCTQREIRQKRTGIFSHRNDKKFI